MKRYLNLLVCFALSVGLMISPALRVVSYADVATGSDASYLYFYNEDVAPMSSLVDITNTVNYRGVSVIGVGVTSSGGTIYVTGDVDTDGSFYITSDDYSSIEYFQAFGVRLSSSALPPRGVYDFQMDFASDFTYDYEGVHYTSEKSLSNAQSIKNSQPADFPLQNHGDLFIEEVVEMKNSSYLDVWCTFAEDEVVRNVGGALKINFKASSGNPTYSSAGTDASQDAYEQAQNSSIIADAVQNLAQNIVSGMEPHYDNILTQLHHVTEQLHAFWDQLYNMFYLPQYARLGEILAAIQGMDEGIVAVIEDLRQDVNNMSLAIQSKLEDVSTAIQDKLDSVTETLTNGFSDNGFQESLDGFGSVLDDVDEAEDALFGFIDGLHSSDKYRFEFFDMNELLANEAFFGGFSCIFYVLALFLEMFPFVYPYMLVLLSISFIAFVFRLNK